MSVTEQQHAPRQHRSPWASYRFDAPAEWRDCRVIDAWFDGAVVELYGFESGELLAGRQLHVGSRPEDVERLAIRTSVRGWVRSANGRLLVLVHFGALTSEARRFLRHRATYQPLV